MLQTVRVPKKATNLSLTVATLDKARELGVPVVDEAELVRLLSGN